MNIPRRLAPVERKGVLEVRDSGARVVPAVYRSAGIRPAGNLDDPCHRRCSSIRSDSGYNLCVQLCHHPGMR